MNSTRCAWSSFVVTVALFDCCHFVLEASPRLRLMIGKEQQERSAVAQGETHNHIYVYYMLLYYREFKCYSSSML
ncbi:uncharacterized protein F5147DRAFT_325198 [Suillus discolor]|uniref:Secreted protein n=1 Tax=Suillus discolor TaxID=1912936 RepID=A0A9P7F0H3_9AGAM|nr:uncharacterized protein F5147DRAFT_325198 [Suillus discolor]KAG2100442.1 hypothetical protein F5147DRAFT_325198 [Suillus discolor]